MPFGRRLRFSMGLGRFLECRLLVVRHFRILILQLGQIRRSRLSIKLVEKPVISRVLLEAGNLALLVIHVAEYDRVRRTYGLTCGYYFSVTDRASILLCLDTCRRNSLRTVRALLHDTAAADRNLRIAHQLVLRRVPILIQHEVESTNFVRAVVRAVPGSNAAVVHHVVEALSTVDRGSHGTNNFAWSLFALLTENRLEVRSVRMAQIVTGEVRVNSHPVHFAASLDLLPSDDRNVIFGLAREDASVATDT